VAHYTTLPLAIDFVNHKIKQFVIQCQLTLQEFGLADATVQYTKLQRQITGSKFTTFLNLLNQYNSQQHKLRTTHNYFLTVIHNLHFLLCSQLMQAMCNYVVYYSSYGNQYYIYYMILKTENDLTAESNSSL